MRRDGQGLLGRRRELRALKALIDAARRGEGRALVLRGEAGAGKSALLEQAAQQATGCRLLRVTGVEAEMELAFAGLHQLCAPLLDRLDRLPGPQAEALRTAFGISAGPAPERFVVGLAVLGLLSEAAADEPLLCLVDDAQWLDRATAQALAFVARRLLAEAVALLCASRAAADEFTGVPELTVAGLDDADARALLRSVIPGPLDDQVRERIVAETRGNPLALLELPRGLTPAEVAGGFGLTDALALPARIEDSFRRRLEPLPAETRELLLLAATDPVGDSRLLWRAAQQLGIGREAAAPAERAELCDFGTQMRFRHPMVRSAVYHAATPDQRRAAHRALADATDPEADPDRRAWHRAHATLAPDEPVAAELERSAGRAQARGGVAAAAAFLEQAAGLTPDPARRARRALAAAPAKHPAGGFDAALGLVAAAEAGPLDELHRARADTLRGQIAFAARRGRDAPPLLLRAARRLEGLDPALARATYLDALSAALFAGPLVAPGGGAAEVAEAARAARLPADRSAPALLLDGAARVTVEGHAAGRRALGDALAAFGADDLSGQDGLRWLWLACEAAMCRYDHDMWRAIADRHVAIARRAGALNVLPIALSTRAGNHLFAGEFARASALIDEIVAVGDATAIPVPYVVLPLAAFRGEEARASALIEAGLEEATARGEGLSILSINFAEALLANGLGRYDRALAAAERASDHLEPLWPPFAIPELVEAAVRSGQPERATARAAEFGERARASGTDWALGIDARSRALLSDGEEAERLYRESIDRLARTSVRTDLARSHLLYGEWLRRGRRRLDARRHLRVAHESFMDMGMDAFAGRAGGELLATGETARKRTPETADQLTAQEAQIARLAREGLSNPEIGARLFISPRTVQYHLGKVFAKLDITSRTQLERVLSSDPNAA
jgi:DNA-binding CsgD family transcriptional regulator